MLLNLFKLYWKSMCSQKTWTTMSADEFWKRPLAWSFQNTSIMNTCIDIHLSFALLIGDQVSSATAPVSRQIKYMYMLTPELKNYTTLHLWGQALAS